ncbi:hypothetical protein LQ772_04660 [Frateuria edaphi]|uniref:hypothetical protein n=1 Tax=Frateuria edaphi TaxID=2898793 RepID=UPI001E4FD098|nr:hypothetical protein [Frateuria edaphi]UGB46592.1 hypothetical protein LQ772_04660 [Frateuria edaphi]
MAWTVLTRGKHEGKTLPQVMFSDPDWFFWAFGTKFFAQSQALQAEADEIFKKARHIKVPQKSGEALRVQHYIHRPTSKYSHFELVPDSQPPHIGASQAIRADVIDMALPRQISQYDKLGYKNFLSSLKHVFFGKDARMTKARCEQFFDQDELFQL